MLISQILISNFIAVRVVRGKNSSILLYFAPIRGRIPTSSFPPTKSSRIQNFPNPINMSRQIRIIQFVINRHINKIRHIRIFKITGNMQQIVPTKSGSGF